MVRRARNWTSRRVTVSAPSVGSGVDLDRYPVSIYAGHRRVRPVPLSPSRGRRL